MAIIEKITYLGQQAVRVQTSQLEGVIVPSWGSNLIALKWRAGEIDLLRSPTDAEQYLLKPVLYGTPVLFPPNRIEDGTFTSNGRTYHFPINEVERNNHIHGFLLDAVWTVDHAETDGDRAVVETTVLSEEVPALYEAFPHKFTVRMQFVFEDNTVTQQFIIENRDSSPIPWGVGYHTTFRVPLSAEGKSEQCTFQLEADKRWVLSERLLPTGELEDFSFKQALAEGMSLDGVILDDVFQVAQQGASESIIVDKEAGLRITYAGDENFKQWVVYTSDGKSGFVCPEPYTWVTNAPNVDLPAELTGFRVLAPGERAAVSTKLSIAQL
ncbi:aldose 1-epimerase [Paenibacillaceae bacterium]|nr:aldose 1-epimerase [Paenibacillaceae bacterium]